MKTENLSEIPALTKDQMREVDCVMTEEYGISLLQMMENAGRSLADLGTLMLGGSVLGKRVFVAAGSGNNGGGGLVAARHLHNRGAAVSVFVLQPEPPGIVGQQLGILGRMGVRSISGSEAAGQMAVGEPDLIVEALIGYGLKGLPQNPAAALIRIINLMGIQVLSLGVPAGLDSKTGETHDPCVKATATMTLALPKTGLLPVRAREARGELYLADISVPPALYSQVGVNTGFVFEKSNLIKLIEN